MTEEQYAECEKFDKLLDQFTVNMRNRFQAKMIQGKTGWDSWDWAEANCFPDMLQKIADILRGDFQEAIKLTVDMANYALFAWYRCRGDENQSEST